MNPFPSARYDEKSFSGLWPFRELRLREQPFSTLDELDRAVAERAIELCLKHADTSLGVLSLSASEEETLWAYYAGDHTGIVIGFDESHPYFRELRPVDYTDEPIFVSTKLGWVRIGGLRLETEDILNSRISEIPSELLFRKRVRQKHEREWRLVAPRGGARIVIDPDSNGYPIHLFDVPPSGHAGQIWLSRVRHNDRWGHSENCLKQEAGSPWGIPTYSVTLGENCGKTTMLIEPAR